MAYRRRNSVFLLLVLGVLFVVGGIWSLNNSIDKINKGVPVSAEVISMETKHGRKNKIMYTPVVRFTTAKGDAISTQLDVSSSSPAYDIGQKVPVIYQPTEPTDVMLDTFFGKYGISLILAGMGAAAIFGGIVEGLRRLGSGM